MKNGENTKDKDFEDIFNKEIENKKVESIRNIVAISIVTLYFASVIDDNVEVDKLVKFLCYLDLDHNSIIHCIFILSEFEGIERTIVLSFLFDFKITHLCIKDKLLIISALDYLRKKNILPELMAKYDNFLKSDGIK